MNPFHSRWIPALLLMTCATHAAERPVAMVREDAPCHRSASEAAEAGIRASARLDRRVEYGGAVFERSPRCFMHSEPVTSLQRDRVEYGVRRTAGLTLVAIYHTHTPGGHDREFSARDRQEQQRLGVPSFLGILGARSERLAIQVLITSGLHRERGPCAPALESQRHFQSIIDGSHDLAGQCTDTLRKQRTVNRYQL